MPLLSTLAFVATLTSADLNGIWMGFTMGRRGNKVDISLKLTQTGNKIGGKLYGEYESNPVVEGTVAGNEINFVVLAIEQQGNQINESRLRFTGKFLNDDELELTRERESLRNAANAGDSAKTATPTPKDTVKLKRLL